MQGGVGRGSSKLPFTRLGLTDPLLSKDRCCKYPFLAPNLLEAILLVEPLRCFLVWTCRSIEPDSAETSIPRPSYRVFNQCLADAMPSRFRIYTKPGDPYRLFGILLVKIWIRGQTLTLDVDYMFP